jgi:hypothetical protein
LWPAVYAVNLHTKLFNMRSVIISFFLILFVCTQGKTQAGLKDTLNFNSSLQPANQANYNLAPFSKYALPVTSIPQNFYVNHLGLFCKKELLLQKTVKLPLSLRLGSVAYTDEMEGKGKGVKREPSGH